MTVYLFIFLILGVIALLMEARLTKGARIGLLIFAYIILVLFVGLRWETGNDWFSYHDYYSSLLSLHDKADEFEIGYRLISLMSKHIGLSYQGFLLAYSSIYLGLIIFSFIDHDITIAGWLVLLFYSSFLLGWMGTARQVMAIGICLFSVRYILRGQLTRFLVCVALAFSFHTSAVCFVLAWPLAKVTLNRLHLWIALALLTVTALVDGGGVLVTYIGEYLNIPYLNEKLLFYQQVSVTDMDLSGGDLTILWYLKRLVSLLLFILLFKLFESATDKLYFKLYLVSTFMFVLLFSSVPMIPLRAGLYFSVFEIFLLALITRRIKRPIWRGIYCTALFLFALSRLTSSLYLYHPLSFMPYKTQFLNNEIVRPG